MNNTLQRVIVLLAFCVATASATEYQTLFSSQALDRAAATYNENITYNWEEELVGRLPLNDRQAASLITLRLPRIGANRGPFDFYADSGFLICGLALIEPKIDDGRLTVPFAISKGAWSRNAYRVSFSPPALRREQTERFRHWLLQESAKTRQHLIDRVGSAPDPPVEE